MAYYTATGAQKCVTDKIKNDFWTQTTWTSVVICYTRVDIALISRTFTRRTIISNLIESLKMCQSRFFFFFFLSATDVVETCFSSPESRCRRVNNVFPFPKLVYRSLRCKLSVLQATVQLTRRSSAKFAETTACLPPRLRTRTNDSQRLADAFWLF